ncbi:MAG: serine/threonine-protein kinase, partial [Myxococcota bacterium]
MLFRKFPARFGKYLLVDRIAAGGMAEVYRAKLPGVENFHKLLAIKCMQPRLTASQGFADMFIDEANLSSNLSHPNIAQMYELGRHDDLLYIAMELVNGRDMGHIIRVARIAPIQIPVTFACYVAVKAAEALDYAHHRVAVDGTPLNLVHRDISPQNILVSYDGEVKVVDFGIAKADVRLVETAGGVLKGKVPYMAPEQARAQPVDNRTDVFALGIVLFETLTGRRLYTARTHLEVMEQARNADVPPIHDRYTHVPPDLEAIIRKALAAEPAGRYSTADELAQALSRFLIDGSVLYGSRQASRFMSELFSDEIEAMRAREQSYATLTLSDCVEVREVTDTIELYSSTFEESTAVANLRRPTDPTDEISSTTLDITVADANVSAVEETPPRDSERTKLVAIGQTFTDRRTLFYTAGGFGTVILIVALIALFSSGSPRRDSATAVRPASSVATPVPVATPVTPVTPSPVV